MTVTLVLPDEMAAELFDVTAAEVETACVLLARKVETPSGDLRLLGPVHCIGCRTMPTAGREATALSIASHGYVPALAVAEADRSVPDLVAHPSWRRLIASAERARRTRRPTAC